MAKYLTNNSVRVICIGSKNIIPGAGPVEVSAKDIEHPIIAAKIKAGILTLTEDSAPETAVAEVTVADAAAADPLAEMTVAQLKAYASKEKIDLGEASKKADIIAIIKAAEAKAVAGE